MKFSSKPEKGARVYYMRTVLHDWPDKQALEALARIKEAMASDSVLILNENTLPEENVMAFSAALVLVVHLLLIAGLAIAGLAARNKA